LHYVANRPAKVGDKLITTRFRESSTRGFAAVGEPSVAVCLLPGTEIALDREVECYRGFGWLPRQTIEAKMARFRQINQDRRTSHRDALEFPDGEIVLLTSLREGQHATTAAGKADAQRRGGADARCRIIRSQDSAKRIHSVRSSSRQADFLSHPEPLTRIEGHLRPGTATFSSCWYLFFSMPQSTPPSLETVYFWA
jgi:hypothetical protein